MRLSFALSSVLLLCSCGESRLPDTLMLRAHSHNDYVHDTPLWRALAEGFRSVEADIWLVDGTIMVSHTGAPFVGTLQDLYLDPLAERVQQLGSIHGDNLPFYLWLDIKDGNETLLTVLAQLLSSYPMLTQYFSDHIDQRAVSLVLTGNVAAKIAFVSACNPCLATRDIGKFKFDDPPGDFRWRWYSLYWFDYFSWNGTGTAPAAVLDGLAWAVGEIHRKGRHVRFYGVPDNPYYWQVALSAGVDLISTDRLPDLATFLQQQESAH